MGTQKNEEETPHHTIGNGAVDTHDGAVSGEGLKSDPNMSAMLYIKPLRERDGEQIRNAWHALYTKKSDAWRDTIERWTVLPDNTVMLTMKDPATVIDMADSIREFLHESFRKDHASFLFPAYVLIDYGASLREDTTAPQAAHMPWEEMVPGDVCITQGAYTAVKKYFPSLPSLVRKDNKDASFLTLHVATRDDEQKPLFLHHDACIEGANPVCFYCGSKNHPVQRCPSKTLPEITDAIRKVGYKSLEEINALFHEYSAALNTSHEAFGDETNQNVVLAHQAFHELKRVFQLRFFRILWDTGARTWDNVKSKINKGNRSGIAWIAQDCIRVSDIPRAESLLEDALKQDPDDYKVHCAWGFMHVEKGDLSRAEHSFGKALSCAGTDPEKIFLNFLLFRVREVTGNLRKARENIEEILAIDPHCAEAVYIDIVSQFRRGERSDALRRLLRLIRDEREHYLYALIDPDLKSAIGILTPHLREIFDDIKEHAARVLRETEEEVRRLKKILSHDEEAIKRIDEQWRTINRLAKTESYFGLLDVVSHGLSMMKSIHRTIGEFRRELSESLVKCDHRIRGFVKFLENYSNKRIALPLVEKLDMLQLMARENWRRIGMSNVDEINVVRNNTQLLFQELEQIIPHMKRLMMIQWMREFSSRFMKKNILFLSIILAAAFVVMPIILYYVNLVFRELRIPPVYDIWLYQIVVVIFGSLCGVILSFFITLYDVPRKDFIVN